MSVSQHNTVWRSLNTSAMNASSELVRERGQSVFVCFCVADTCDYIVTCKAMTSSHTCDYKAMIASDAERDAEAMILSTVGAGEQDRLQQVSWTVLYTHYYLIIIK